MPARSNFQEAIREAQSSALIGPNVVNKALPYVGGGMVLTAGGVLGGMSLMASAPALFMPLFWVALIGNFILFFVAQNAATKGNAGTALPILTAYSLITGFTLSGIVSYAVTAAGVGAVGTAALATGITFVIASFFGRRMSDNVGQALSGVVGLGIIGLVIAMVVQLVGGLFAPTIFTGGTFELMIAGFGTVIFVGAAFVDFYTMPRTYSDDQYLAGALGMYLTYINLFVFILRLIIALQGGGRRD
ncbi:Bax inhibitor-1 family protein [Cyanobium sp. N5-Cardenillas]|uniref:Bax inhibitor-1/YccA family protein n=1 Tax=Cyanobium sp. N5-Cardenillas TaxID=2823720 RepID=UPI0020CBDFD8|nr:Bax inhibitor-1 family protein [Cyanobium sp. N5-Cardenillas]MCP9786100.1 US12 family protein [Cyanobium sp. N5-Cardenillas]